MSAMIDKTRDEHTRQERAQNEYALADDYAKMANREAGNARELIPVWQDQKERLEHWDRIMATAPVGIFSITFVFICIAEYYFSRELYRDISEDYPWAIALGLVAVAILISELLVYRFSPAKRRLKFYELRRNPNLATETDEALEAKVMRLTNSYFVGGLLLAVAMLAGLYYLSQLRVEKEILAGLRESEFGIQDLMPVILYVAEIISGVFIWYLIKRTWLWLKVRRLEKKVKSHVDRCAELTSKAVDQFADAERKGYSVLEEPVSDDVHEAFYRHDQRDARELAEYVSKCEPVAAEVTLVILDADKKPVQANVGIVTDFKFSASSATDDEGRVVLHLQVYPGDTVRDIYVEQQRDQVTTVRGAYAFGREHVIFL